MNRHMDLSNQDKINLKNLKMLEETEWFVEVNVLSSGKDFGELALINKEPRAATIKCLTNCYLAVLEEDDYQRVLKKAHQRAETKKIEFLSQLPFLKHLNQGTIRLMQRSFVE